MNADRDTDRACNTDERYPLEWIDDYVERLRGFVYVRERDNLLIKVPNEAHKLNESGVRILKSLLGGMSVDDLWQSCGHSLEVRRDLYNFFVGLKRVLQGCINERHLPEAVESKPFALGFNALPILSEVALTYRCNLQCRFCYAGCSCTKKEDADEEMSTDAIRRVLRIIREDAETPSVSFTGGEPTLREDLPQLVAYASRELGLRVNLITNGTLVDRSLAERLKDSGLHSAQISLESPVESVHDRLVMVKQSFRKTLDAIRHLRECGIHVHTNTTLNRLNIEHATQMPAFVQSLDLCRFSMNLIIPSGSSRTANPDLNLTYTEVADILVSIQEEARMRSVDFMWYSPTPICIFNPIQHQMGNKGCAACDGLLSVSPTGDILPCSSWPEPVGNLLGEPFEKVWESARARWVRAKSFAPRACDGCEDFALCQGACPLYWEHFGYQELETCGANHVATCV